MMLLIGAVQSTSSVDFFGIDIIGDWCAIVKDDNERSRRRAARS
jgi:hypothetical protein